MSIDVRTLLLVLAIVQLIQVFVFALQCKLNKSYSGDGWWLLWSASETIGFGLSILRNIPAMASFIIVLQNTFIVLGIVFLFVGIIRFLGKKENKQLIIIIFSLYLISLTYFVFINDNVRSRSVIINLMLAVFLFLSAWNLYHHKLKSITNTANILTFFLTIQGIYFVARTIFIISGIPVDDYFIPSFFNSLVYFDAIIIGILIMIGFILMLNQRLNSDITEAKLYFETLFKVAPDATIISRLEDGMILNVNQGFTNLTGYSVEETLGKSSHELTIWQNLGERQKVALELSQKGVCENYEAGFLSKDGKKIVGLFFARTFILNGSTLILSVIRDITDLKKTEDDLRALKDHLAIEVEEKTKALKDHSDLLERFHQATVDREIKMKELREEIKQLKNQESD